MPHVHLELQLPHPTGSLVTSSFPLLGSIYLKHSNARPYQCPALQTHRHNPTVCYSFPASVTWHCPLDIHWSAITCLPVVIISAHLLTIKENFYLFFLPSLATTISVDGWCVWQTSSAASNYLHKAVASTLFGREGHLPAQPVDTATQRWPQHPVVGGSTPYKLEAFHN